MDGPVYIDDMPGGFPFDFTMPAALEKDEFINYHMVRALMIAFPQYAWDEWLDRHGQQVHLDAYCLRPRRKQNPGPLPSGDLPLLHL